MLWLSQFPSRQEAELITSIRRFARIFGPVLAMGTSCSGTDIVSKCDVDICNVLRCRYGVDLAPKQVLACEWDEKKQKVLCKENPEVDLLVADLALLNNQRVPNVLQKGTDSLVLVPPMDSYRCGSVCLL